MDAGEDLFGRHAGVLGRYTDGMLSPPLQMLPVMVAGWVNRCQLAVIDYGYRRITAMLRQDGWPVKHKRVERI